MTPSDELERAIERLGLEAGLVQRSDTAALLKGSNYYFLRGVTWREVSGESGWYSLLYKRNGGYRVGRRVVNLERYLRQIVRSHHASSQAQWLRFDTLDLLNKRLPTRVIQVEHDVGTHTYINFEAGGEILARWSNNYWVWYFDEFFPIECLVPLNARPAHLATFLEAQYWRCVDPLVLLSAIE